MINYLTTKSRLLEKMKAKRIFNIGLWVLLCVPCLLVSCDHDAHNDEDEGGYNALVDKSYLPNNWKKDAASTTVLGENSNKIE